MLLRQKKRFHGVAKPRPAKKGDENASSTVNFYYKPMQKNGTKDRATLLIGLIRTVSSAGPHPNKALTV